MLSDECGRKLNTYIPNYVVFDLETTGTSCYSDAVVEISAVKVKDGKVVDEFSTLVDPQRHIPFFATNVNGITDDMVKGCPLFKTALADFLDFAGNEVLVGHNIQTFDLKFIYREAQDYTVKDPEAAKNELLGRAVKDAKAKAAVLADASDVKLKEIQTIDYSWDELDFEVRPMSDMMLRSEKCMEAGGSYDFDIEPDDIEVSDTVTVVWEIV